MYWITLAIIRDGKRETPRVFKFSDEVLLQEGMVKLCNFARQLVSKGKASHIELDADYASNGSAVHRHKEFRS